MKNKKYDEVLNKMLFLQDDINGKFIGIVILEISHACFHPFHK